ncbi:MAG: nicotinate-nucleotide--dimethylbenzimidazole phosphoribosyltransferase [Lachnospiraceae bacterium]|nr:nicotinate-nucleotide--dimethylbenzimidazole phosphoribosyltransferase [Lachnospiraceae bacterium]
MESGRCQIISLNEEARKASYAHWDSLAKPLGSLGMLEDVVAQIAAITGNPDVRLDRRTLFVLCGDHGVIGNGVTQTGASVTAAVAKAIGESTSTISYLAAGQNIDVIPVDVGMLPHPDFPGVQNRNVRPGTADLSKEPAMTREECVQAIRTGIDLVWEEKKKGTQIVLTGEMGIGNTTATSAVGSVLLAKEPVEMTGRGSGLSSDGLAKKIACIKQGIACNKPNPDDAIDVLSKVGGLELAGLCGLYLGGAICRMPILLDGVITLAAALCAVRIQEKPELVKEVLLGCTSADREDLREGSCAVMLSVRDVLLASHMSAEPSTRYLMETLGLSAPINAGLRLGEGSGAVAALLLIDMALREYQSAHTFDVLGIEAYTPQG